MTTEDAEGFLARNFHDRRKNAPVSQESGLPLHEELEQAGFLSGEDADNFVIHYGLGPEHELAYNRNTGGRDVLLKNQEEGPMCANCGEEEVESPGHFCDDCDANDNEPFNPKNAHLYHSPELDNLRKQGRIRGQDYEDFMDTDNYKGTYGEDYHTGGYYKPHVGPVKEFHVGPQRACGYCNPGMLTG
jgi:hypothetical protein